MPGNKKIEELLKQPMNRREFLRNIGLLFISIIGISNALHILGGRPIHRLDSKSGKGFGGGKYGA